MKTESMLAPQMFEVFGALIVVLGMIFALAWFLKRTPAFNMNGAQSLKIIQTLPVGNKERVVLIEIEGKKVLLGVTANQVSALWDKESVSVTDAEEKEKLDARDLELSEKSFSQHFSNLLNRKIAC